MGRGRRKSAKPKTIKTHYLKDVTIKALEYLSTSWNVSKGEVIDRAVLTILAMEFKDTRHLTESEINGEKQKLEVSIKDAISALDRIQEHQESEIILEKINTELKRVTVRKSQIKEIHYARCSNCDWKAKMKDPEMTLSDQICPSCKKSHLVREIKIKTPKAEQMFE